MLGKVFECVCGNKTFWMIEQTKLLVRWDLEGAVSGHPRIGGRGLTFMGFECTACGETVPSDRAIEMKKEVI